MPGYCSPDESYPTSHHYYAWREETLITYPHVICMPNSAPMAEISKWKVDTGLDYLWHLSRFNTFDFYLGYDFFFKQVRDAALFKLAWGGITVDLTHPQFHLFYF